MSNIKFLDDLENTAWYQEVKGGVRGGILF